MTQQSTIARGQQGGNEVPLLGEQFWRHPRDDTVLLGGDELNRSGFSSVSEGNPNWFGHAAMVGALAVPAQRPVCTNSAQESPPLTAHQHDAPGDGGHPPEVRCWATSHVHSSTTLPSGSST